MEKTIICLAKMLAEKEAAYTALQERYKKLEDQVAEYMGTAHGLSNVTQEQDGIISELNGKIVELECKISAIEAEKINLIQKVAELEQAAEAKPKKCGNTKPRTPEQLEVLKRGREKAAAKRAAAKRANGITPERPKSITEQLRIAEGADF